MAVYTAVTVEEAQTLMTALGLGRLRTLQGCASGIENTNYFATTEGGDYVLTLFERLSFEQLPYYLELMRHLAGKGIAVPAPQPDAHGAILHRLKDKPAAVVTRLAGGNVMAPRPAHCAQVAATLARMHLGVADFTMQQPNLRGLAWWREVVPTLLPYLDETRAQLLRSELEHQERVAASADYARLAVGAIHADLFRDNVMFEGDQLSGCFDFYFAGNDTFLFDLCVCLNDWCLSPLIEVDADRTAAFLQAYESVRALSEHERRLLPDLLRAAALRFWCSRLWDWHLPRAADMLKPHDPGHFEAVLRLRRASPDPSSFMKETA